MSGPLRPRSRLRLGLLLACALLLPAGRAAAAGDYSEAAVEAAFLYRFAGYIEWPGDSLPGQRFTIAVMDADEVAAELEQFLPTHPIKGRTASVERITALGQLGDAQMLYVGPGHPEVLRGLPGALGSRAVLVVTNDEHGLAAGGAINFLRDGRRVRFEVSLAASERARLHISSELLAVAVRVERVPLRSLNRPPGDDLYHEVA